MKAICCSVNFDFFIGELFRQPLGSEADFLTINDPVWWTEHGSHPLGTLICIKAAGCAGDHCGGTVRAERGAERGDDEMALGFADPFDTLFRFQRALDQQLDSDWLEDATGGVGAFPPINVFRQGGDFVAIIEMPGVSKDDLGLEVRGNAIRISGKKTIDYGGDASVHRRERIAGSFDRTITLPVQLDADRITAEYRDGILALSLPHAESDKPKAIKIS
jgi:HSP20 family protein